MTTGEDKGSESTYWLIERGSPAEWWVCGSGKGDGTMLHEEWTRDASRALRFNEVGATRHAAELESWGVRGPLRATEHMDCAGPDMARSFTAAGGWTGRHAASITPQSAKAPSSLASQDFDELTAVRENRDYWKQLAESLGGLSAASRSAIACKGEPLAWAVESSHSGDINVCEIFDDERVAGLHAVNNGGIVHALYKWSAATPPTSAPIEMLLFCPRCEEQHIDAPKGDWTNPPHATHTCQHCGLNWRPSNALTTGVKLIKCSEAKHEARADACFPSYYRSSASERGETSTDLKEYGNLAWNEAIEEAMRAADGIIDPDFDGLRVVMREKLKSLKVVDMDKANG